MAGEYPTAAMMNAEVRDSVNFLANPPSCRVYHSAAQTIAHNTPVALAFNSERLDTDNMHDTVTNNSRITFNAAGLYVITASVQWQAAATGTRYLLIWHNTGANLVLNQISAAGTAESHAMSCTTIYKCASGTYVECRVYQFSGAALNIQASASYSPEFSATWVGKG